MKKQNYIKRGLIYVSMFFLMTASFHTGAKAFDVGMPSESKLQDIVKDTLLDFNDAVQDEDFSDFYSNICRPWQKQISAADLQKTFQGFIDKGINIDKIRSMQAVFAPKPAIKTVLKYRTLVLKGYYPTKPNTTKFFLHFIQDTTEWKLSRIEVDTTSG